MSHIAKIELEVTDLEALSKACNHMGLNLVKNKTTHKWYYGDATCDHMIEVPNARYEIGIHLRDGKYELSTDFWDKEMETTIGKNGGLLKQRYVVERTKAEAIRKGYRVIEKEIDNSVRLHVRM